MQRAFWTHARCSVGRKRGGRREAGGKIEAQCSWRVMIHMTAALCTEPPIVLHVSYLPIRLPILLYVLQAMVVHVALGGLPATVYRRLVVEDSAPCCADE
jgi:hypothetical protein